MKKNLFKQNMVAGMSKIFLYLLNIRANPKICQLGE